LFNKLFFYIDSFDLWRYFPDILEIVENLNTYYDLYKFCKVLWIEEWRDYSNFYKSFLKNFNLQNEDILNFLETTYISSDIKKDISKFLENKLKQQVWINFFKDRNKEYEFIKYLYNYLYKNFLKKYILPNFLNYIFKKKFNNIDIKIDFLFQKDRKKVDKIFYLYNQDWIEQIWNQIKQWNYWKIIRKWEKVIFDDINFKQLIERYDSYIDIWGWFVERKNLFKDLGKNKQLILIDISDRLLINFGWVSEFKNFNWLVTDFFELNRQFWGNNLWFLLWWTFWNFSKEKQIEFLKKYKLLKWKNDKLVLQIFTDNNLKYVNKMYNTSESKRFVLWWFKKR